MSNKELLQGSLSGISRELIEKAIRVAYRDGIVSSAPLGYSGATIMLYGINEPRRKSQVSIRNHSGNAEMLITDIEGTFLFHGKFHIGLGVEWIANHYYNIFCLIEEHIETLAPTKSRIALV